MGEEILDVSIDLESNRSKNKRKTNEDQITSGPKNKNSPKENGPPKKQKVMIKEELIEVSSDLENNRPKIATHPFEPLNVFLAMHPLAELFIQPVLVCLLYRLHISLEKLDILLLLTRNNNTPLCMFEKLRLLGAASFVFFALLTELHGCLFSKSNLGKEVACASSYVFDAFVDQRLAPVPLFLDLTPHWTNEFLH